MKCLIREEAVIHGHMNTALAVVSHRTQRKLGGLKVPSYNHNFV